MNKNFICFHKDEWLFEKEIPHTKDIAKIGIKIKKKIFSQKTPYQEIEVFDTFSLGRILVLDGVIQLSQFDDFIYHEMLVHPAMFCHKNPKKVLIIGGGDGGALREVLKHPVREAYLVDIDKEVMAVSKKYLPFVSNKAFEDKRAKVLVEDGLKFIKKYKNFFDVIIIDSTDPFGPSLSIFSSEFYRNIFNALTDRGIAVVQSGCLIDQFPHLKSICKRLKNTFPFIEIKKACVPCLGCSSEYTFTVAGKASLENKINILQKKFKKSKLSLKYYSPEIHVSSQVLPEYLKERL